MSLYESGMSSVWEWCVICMRAVCHLYESGVSSVWEWYVICMRVVCHLYESGVSSVWEWCVICMRVVCHLYESGVSSVWEWCVICMRVVCHLYESGMTWIYLLLFCVACMFQDTKCDLTNVSAARYQVLVPVLLLLDIYLFPYLFIVNSCCVSIIVTTDFRDMTAKHASSVITSRISSVFL